MKPPIDPAIAARIELATPFRYHLQMQPPSQEPWWQRAWDAFESFLTRLFAHVRGGHGAAVAIGDALLVIAVVLVAYLLARLVLALPTQARGAASGLAPLAPQRDERSLARAAYAAAERGELSLAVRLLFRAAVALLDLRGTIRDDASATVGELRRAVRPHGDVVVAAFGEIAAVYVTCVYAQRPVEGVSWRRVHAAYEALARNPPT